VVTGRSRRRVARSWARRSRRLRGRDPKLVLGDTDLVSHAVPLQLGGQVGGPLTDGRAAVRDVLLGPAQWRTTVGRIAGKRVEVLDVAVDGAPAKLASRSPCGGMYAVTATSSSAKA
jgi:hypothetical protein